MSLEGFLKTGSVTVRGREFQIRELCTQAQIEMVEASRSDDGLKAVVIACKHGVLDWAEKTVEEIASSVPLSILQQIAESIYDLSGVESKNSESDPSEDSSSD